MIRLKMMWRKQNDLNGTPNRVLEANVVVRAKGSIKYKFLISLSDKGIPQEPGKADPSCEKKVFHSDESDKFQNESTYN